MASLKWLVVANACLLTSIFLQLFGFLTPGWFIMRTTDDSKTSTGLMYVVRCTENEGCAARSLGTQLAGDTPQSKYFAISSIVRSLIQSVLSLIVCSVVTVLMTIGIKRTTWTDPYTTASLTCLALAVTLQWDLVADYSNMNSTFPQFPISFPWSVFIYALGSFLTSIVLVAHFVKFVMKVRLLNNTDEITLSDRESRTEIN